MVAAFVAGERLAEGDHCAVRVVFFEKEPRKIVHRLPAHGHRLDRHDEEGLMEGGFGLVNLVECHINASDIDERQSGGVGGPGVADGAVTVAQCVIVFLILKVSEADVGIGDALAFEDLVVGNIMGSKPVITEGKGCEKLFDDKFGVSV